MKWFKNTHEIIELVKENAELKRGIGDMMLFIIEAQKGRNHKSIVNSNDELRFVYLKLMDWANRLKLLEGVKESKYEKDEINLQESK